MTLNQTETHWDSSLFNRCRPIQGIDRCILPCSWNVRVEFPDWNIENSAYCVSPRPLLGIFTFNFPFLHLPMILWCNFVLVYDAREKWWGRDKNFIWWGWLQKMSFLLQKNCFYYIYELLKVCFKLFKFLVLEKMKRWKM